MREAADIALRAPKAMTVWPAVGDQMVHRRKSALELRHRLTRQSYGSCDSAHGELSNFEDFAEVEGHPDRLAEVDLARGV